MTIVVRSAAGEDLPAITEIYGWSVENESASYEDVAPSLETMQRRYLELQSQGFPYLVAVKTGTGQAQNVRPSVVGFAYASPFRARAGYRSTVEDTVYVAPSAQRLGVGHALLSRLIQACSDANFRQILAVVGGSNPGPSIALHTRCGFAEVGRLESIGFKFGEWHDVIILQRSLAGSEL